MFLKKNLPLVYRPKKVKIKADFNIRIEKKKSKKKYQTGGFYV